MTQRMTLYLFSIMLTLVLSGCATLRHSGENTSSMPYSIHSLGEKAIVVDPRTHTWGAYSASGYLIRSGTATVGKSWCPDIGRSCRTSVGHFRIYSLGNKHCKSSKFPRPNGGAPMPYCMFFNGGQAFHGSNQVVRRHASHGCVRLHVADAEWIRHNFAESPSSNNGYRGTRVIIKPY